MLAARTVRALPSSRIAQAYVWCKQSRTATVVSVAQEEGISATCEQHAPSQQSSMAPQQAQQGFGCPESSCALEGFAAAPAKPCSLRQQQDGPADTAHTRKPLSRKSRQQEQQHLEVHRTWPVEPAPNSAVKLQQEIPPAPGLVNEPLAPEHTSVQLADAARDHWRRGASLGLEAGWAASTATHEPPLEDAKRCGQGDHRYSAAGSAISGGSSAQGKQPRPWRGEWHSAGEDIAAQDRLLHEWHTAVQGILAQARQQLRSTGSDLASRTLDLNNPKVSAAVRSQDHSRKKDALERWVKAVGRTNSVERVLQLAEQARALDVVLPCKLVGSMAQLLLKHEQPAAAEQVLEHVRSHNVLWDEICWTIAIRAAAARGDTTQATQHLRDMVAAGVSPKLRSLEPLVDVALQTRDVAALLDLHKVMSGLKHPLEYFFIKVALQLTGPAWGGVPGGRQVLDRYMETMAAAHGSLSTEGFALMRMAGTRLARISPDGHCEHCNGRLTPTVLPLELRRDMLQAIRQAPASTNRERAAIDGCQRALLNLARRPTVVVDGMNVALSGASHKQMHQTTESLRGLLFRPHRLVSMMQQLEAEGEWPVIILPAHYAGTKRGFAPRALLREWLWYHEECLENWYRRGQVIPIFHTVDDRCLMLASVLWEDRVVPVITNDLFRDHATQTVDEHRLFQRWVGTHTIRFQVMTGVRPVPQIPSERQSIFQFLRPEVCNTEMQRAQGSDAWHIPVLPQLSQMSGGVSFLQTVPQPKWLCLAGPGEVAMAE